MTCLSIQQPLKTKPRIQKQFLSNDSKPILLMRLTSGMTNESFTQIPTNPNITFIPPRMLKDFNAGLLLDKCNDVIEVGRMLYLDINHTAKKRHSVSSSQTVDIYKSKKVEEYGNGNDEAGDIKCLCNSSNTLPIGFKRNLRQ